MRRRERESVLSRGDIVLQAALTHTLVTGYEEQISPTTAVQYGVSLFTVYVHKVSQLKSRNNEAFISQIRVGLFDEAS